MKAYYNVGQLDFNLKLKVLLLLILYDKYNYNIVYSLLLTFLWFVCVNIFWLVFIIVYFTYCKIILLNTVFNIKLRISHIEICSQYGEH